MIVLETLMCRRSDDRDDHHLMSFRRIPFFFLLGW
jgi:hypothetical protein